LYVQSCAAAEQLKGPPVGLYVWQTPQCGVIAGHIVCQGMATLATGSTVRASASRPPRSPLVAAGLCQRLIWSGKVDFHPKQERWHCIGLSVTACCLVAWKKGQCVARGKKQRGSKSSRIRMQSGGGTWLRDPLAQASLQLPPESLHIEPPPAFTTEEQSKTSAKAQSDSAGLSGDWLPLFRSSAPYIAMFRNSVMVFHIPGWLFDAEHATLLENLMGDVALCKLLGVRPVLILSLEHQLLERMRQEHGVGDLNSLADYNDHARSLLKQQAGEVYFEIERVFQRLAQGMIQLTGGHNCFGSSFPVYATSQLVTGVKLPGGVSSNLQGRVSAVDATQMSHLLAAGDVVCLTSLCLSNSGVAYYVPSEEVATEVAIALKATKLIFFGRGERVVDTRRGRVVATLQLKDARAFVDFTKAQEIYATSEASYVKELIGYLEVSIEALCQGTTRAHIIDARPGDLLQELYTTDGSGMMVSQDLYDGLRIATPSDVSAILELTEPLVAAGLLRRRSGYEVECACNRGELFLWSRDGSVIGCALLEPFKDAPDWAELGCFVIAPSRRRGGYGAVLLSYVERIAKLSGVRNLFLLTTQTMAWFIERGFKEAPVSELPASKQAKYDVTRSSRVYVKRLDNISTDTQERFAFVEVDAL